MPSARSEVSQLDIQNVDRDGYPLRVGDRVGFTMRGWFLPREQESFGVITAIDHRGAVTIDVIESYRYFTSSRRVGLRERLVIFTHHRYDAKMRTRVFAVQSGDHLLSIFRINTDEFERQVKISQADSAT